MIEEEYNRLDAAAAKAYCLKVLFDAFSSQSEDPVVLHGCEPKAELRAEVSDVEALAKFKLLWRYVAIQRLYFEDLHKLHANLTEVIQFVARDKLKIKVGSRLMIFSLQNNNYSRFEGGRSNDLAHLYALTLFVVPDGASVYDPPGYNEWQEFQLYPSYFKMRSSSHPSRAHLNIFSHQKMLTVALATAPLFRHKKMLIYTLSGAYNDTFHCFKRVRFMPDLAEPTNKARRSTRQYFEHFRKRFSQRGYEDGCLKFAS